ncbi:MAG: spermidine synthase, partial [Alphaproteobacteria bacterium]
MTTMPLYAAVVFGNAFLLFLVQPLAGKAILPWFGGSAAVWTVCMLFFQSLLLAGYGLAHAMVRLLPPRGQGLAQLALVAASLAALPLAPDRALAGAADPALGILAVLGASVGLPYLVLCTTSPLLQRWFAVDLPGRSPYRLFALSNLASMLSLLLYPFAIEPSLGLRQQMLGWSLAYAVLALPFAALALRRALRDAGAEAPLALAEAPAPPALVACWVALSAAASLLLLAATGQLTQNVAPVPLLWLAPLALYLLSFILCFESARWYRRRAFLVLAALALPALALLPLADLETLPVEAAVPAYLVGSFLVFMACHGELARLRPGAGGLTGYYLWISLGGALGGLGAGILAPRLLDSDHDLAIAIFLAAAALLAALVVGAARRPRLPMLAAGALALAALAVLLAWMRIDETRFALASSRNFYGTLRIEETGEAGDPDERRQLVHGRIMHGEQLLAPGREMTPTSYYGAQSGVGLAIAATRRAEGGQRVGVIGLGAGVMAAHGRPGDLYRFYEIDPQVERLARAHFTFLSGSPARTEVVLGDARLVLEREAPRSFDVLAVDAFTGDAIPVHLLTEEAFATWLRHLREGGILAVHVSNKYLDLAPVVRLAAERAGWQARLVDDPGDEGDEVASASSWVLVARGGDIPGEEI